MHPARKEIDALVLKTFETIEPDKINYNKYKNKVKNMSDDEYFEFIKGVSYNPDHHIFFEIEMMKENQIQLDRIVEAAKLNNVKLFDRIGFRDIVDGETVYTTHEMFIGRCPIRKVQQFLSKKNSMPKDINKVNPRTGQVTGKSKGGRVSDMELFGLIVQDIPNVIKEYFGPKSGDPVMKQQMYHSIATTGSASLAEMTNNKMNKVALNTANMILLGAGLESDLVTQPGLILPRTFKQQNVKGITRRGDL